MLHTITRHKLWGILSYSQFTRNAKATNLMTPDLRQAAPVTTIKAKLFSTVQVNRKPPLSEQIKNSPNYNEVPQSIALVKFDDEIVKVKFSDDSIGSLPYPWLRENCQCPKCFDASALARKFLLKDLSADIKPVSVTNDENKLEIMWPGGHVSVFESNWLLDRAFNERANDVYRKYSKPPVELWGPEGRLERFNYCDLLENQESLLEWLMVLESKGAAIVNNTPRRAYGGCELIDYFAFVRHTHYGRSCPVFVRNEGNNLAFTGNELGLHLDLPFNDQQPGMIFLQVVKQHSGEGGDSVTSDGFKAAQILRENHPEHFEILTKTNVYFWDKGNADLDREVSQFHVINKRPTIQLDDENQVIRVSHNNQVRDSHFDITWNKVKPFYQALIIFNKILYDNSLTFKMESGDMLCLHNERCLHGRTAFYGDSDRHIETFYADMDMIRSARRNLQDKIGE